VGITPGAGFVTTSGAFVIGIATGFFCRYGVQLKHWAQFDDALDAFGIHFVAGVAGGLFVGLFAQDNINDETGAFHGNGRQFGLQIYGLVVTAAWAAFFTGVIMFALDRTFGLRVSEDAERIGLDTFEHGFVNPRASSGPRSGEEKNRGSSDRKKPFKRIGQQLANNSSPPPHPPLCPRTHDRVSMS
jgi:ammonia channel protein AmtB